MIFRISKGNSKNTVSSSQLFRQDAIAKEYLLSHFAAKSPRTASAACFVGAV